MRIMDPCGDLLLRTSSLLKLRRNFYAQLEAGFELSAKEKKQQVTQRVLTGFGCIPLATNILAMVILMGRAFRARHRSFRKHLVILTTAEIIFSCAFVNYYLWSSCLPLIGRRVRLAEGLACFITAAFSLLVGAQAARNWMVAAVSIARAEAIARPLSSLRRRFVTTRRLRAFLAIVLTIAVVYSTTENFHPSSFVYCGEVTSKNSTNATVTWSVSSLTTARRFVLFSFIRLLPIALTVFSTVVIMVKLLRKNAVRGRQDGSSRTRAAAFTVTTIAVSFSVFESVGCSLFLSAYFLEFSFDTQLVIMNVDKYLLLLNSISNVVAFVFCSRTFRKQAEHMITTTHRRASEFDTSRV